MAKKVHKKKKYISIKGAKLHNLKNISLDIPHNKFIVITGVSGSGKSSLAFDTIYAEGQRRFVESLSAYARQFLERMNKPDVDIISGIPPAIAIEQKPLAKNPRSTVGTSTEIYDYLRLLFARIGKTYCYQCGKIVKKDTPESIVKDILNGEEGDKILILFPFSDQVTNVKEELNNLRELGFFRVYHKVKKELIDYDDDLSINFVNKDEYLVLADRLILKKDDDTLSRLTDSIELAFRTSEGRIEVQNLSKNKSKRYSKLFECSECEIVYLEPEPRLFSFNNPFGACPNCQGFGRTIDIDEDLVIPDKTKSIKKGAIHPFRTEILSKYLRSLIRIAPKYRLSLNTPYNQLPEDDLKIIWEGADDYIGINGFFDMLEEKNYKINYRVLLSKYRGYTKCKACGGSRIRTSARQVFINKMNIPELIDLPLKKVLDFINSLELNEYEETMVGQVVAELKWRLGLLIDIGLDYLTLSRLTHTLSGGEAQRINLSTALGSSLVGTLYVLDEPSVGMHPRDTKRLLNILNKLKNLGNTIIVVEHDMDIIREADVIIDLGPYAGEKGGELIHNGDLESLMNNPKSLTGLYLSKQKKISIPKHKKKISLKDSITIIKPRKHNLKMDKVVFPLHCFSVVTGVSGSGKSTLVNDILYSYTQKVLNGYSGFKGSFYKISGIELIDNVEMVDQSPLGRSSRSTPGTYTKAFDAIRELYASLQISKQLGISPGYFSFNVSGGRCEVCEGEGRVKIEMQFMPDISLECEVCHGSRYKKEVSSITYKEKSIVDVLDMTIDEAIVFFKEHKRIINRLKNLQDVGLGYLKLGQPSTMLSGGESQRVKLASHLGQKTDKNTLFIFDEPTTGLHIDDISKLLACFHQLIANGHSIIVIEHNLQIMASADWIIDLGPEAGENGGQIVVEGKPEEIINDNNSYTAKALNEYFNNEN